MPFAHAACEVDESWSPPELPAAYLERVVAAKLRAAAALPQAQAASGLLVADTIVVSEGAILGKPQSRDEARGTLRSLAGRTHHVSTRFALRALGSGRELAQTVTSDVTFRPLHRDALEAYVATGEGADKAGGYAIQGLGGFLVTELRGSYSAVVGLPVAEVADALVAVGLAESFPLPF